jgi:hypothetical protein
MWMGAFGLSFGGLLSLSLAQVVGVNVCAHAELKECVAMLVDTTVGDAQKLVEGDVPGMNR